MNDKRIIAALILGVALIVSAFLLRPKRWEVVCPSPFSTCVKIDRNTGKTWLGPATGTRWKAMSEFEAPPTDD